MKVTMPKDAEQKYRDIVRRRELPGKIITWTLIVLMVLAIGGFIAFQIWLRVKYANCTIDEIPAWALWWMFNRG